MSYWQWLFRHSPSFSAEFIVTLKQDTVFSEDHSEVEQKGIFLLSNGKYAYARYSGLLNDEKSGLTEVLEFDTLSEALEIYG